MGSELLEAITRADASVSPVLWWLGHSGFAVKFFDIIFYLDPALAPDPARTTLAPMQASDVTHADMILCSHAHPRHLDPATVTPMLCGSRRAKIVLPKSAATAANTSGIPFDRMTTT